MVRRLGLEKGYDAPRRIAAARLERDRTIFHPATTASPITRSHSLILSLSLFLPLLSINYSLLLFRLFVPLSVFRVPPSHPFSSFTSVFVAFAPRSLRLVRAHTYTHTLSLLSFCISPHSVQYRVGACTERYAARLSAGIDTHVDHACTPVTIYGREYIRKDIPVRW